MRKKTLPASFTHLLYHAVFRTKRGLPLIDDELRGPLYGYIESVLSSVGGKLLQVGGAPDHVHLLFRLSSTVTISEAVRLVKSNTSRWLNENRRVSGGFGWHSGYDAFTVSPSRVDEVRRYIRDQKTYHETYTLDDELRAMAREHGIEDERYPDG